MSAVGTQFREGIRAVSTLRGWWVAILVLTSVATIATLLTIPFSAEEGEFLHALRSGEVTSAAVGHSADFETPVSAINVSRLAAGDDIAVSWVSRYGFRRVAVLGTLQRSGPVAQTDAAPATPALDPSASIVKTAKSLGTAPPRMVQPGELPYDNLIWLTVLVTILMIGVVIRGPQPRRMTKWAAFWACLFQLNVGIFYLLLRDAPWNERMNALPEPKPGVAGVVVNPVTNERIRRYGGWTMCIGFGLLTSLGLSLLLTAVSWVFPKYLDPVAWSAVNLAGTPTAP